MRQIRTIAFASIALFTAGKATAVAYTTFDGSCSVQITAPIPSNGVTAGYCLPLVTVPTSSGITTSGHTTITGLRSEGPGKVDSGAILDSELAARRQYGDLAVWTYTRLGMFGNGVGGRAESVARATVYDTITPSNNSLQNGAPILLEVRYELSFDSTLQYWSQAGIVVGRAKSEFTVDAGTSLIGDSGIGVVSLSSASSYPTYTPLASGHHSFTQLVTAQNMNPFQLRMIMRSQSLVEGYTIGAEIGDSRYSISATGALGDLPYSGLQIYITPVASNLTLLSESGHIYTAPVPEASVYHLILVGISALYVYCRRRFLANESEQLRADA